VSINLNSFDELTKDEKQQLFDNCVQAYVEYPEELKEKGKKLAMKDISHSWRTYKSKLVKCWRNNENPFDKYKDLTQEDWERFVAKYQSPDFAKESEYMQWL
jgi:hypothetical protein